MGRTGMHTGFWREDLMGKDHFKDQGVGGSIILKLMLSK
jgi:hypothetical protein